MPPKQKLPLKSKVPQFDALTLAMSDDDDDFQNPGQAISLTQNLIISSFEKTTRIHCSQPLKPTNGARSSKKPKQPIGRGKENIRIPSVLDSKGNPELNKSCISTSVESTLLQQSTNCSSRVEKDCFKNDVCTEFDREKGYKSEMGCLSNLIGSRSPDSSMKNGFSGVDNGRSYELGLDEGVSAEKMEEKGLKSGKDCSLTSIEYRLLDSNMSCSSKADYDCLNEHDSVEDGKTKEFKLEAGRLSNSIESRLLASRTSYSSGVHDDSFDNDSLVDFEPGTQLNVLMKLCSEMDDEEDPNGIGFQEGNDSGDGLVQCPLCGFNISELSEELRQVHTNNCLDREEIQKVPTDNASHGSPQKVDVSPVLTWLRNLGLSRYEEAFAREEIDWDTLQWLTEEDLFSIGVTALGPRKKIVHMLNELRKSNKHVDDRNTDASKVSSDETKNLAGNKLITEYFPGFSGVDRNRDCTPSRAKCGMERSVESTRKRVMVRNHAKSRKVRDIPSWCFIPGTPFRVDAFRYLRGDCSHWFLTHFHVDHYQGLTRSFFHGKVYCSSITAQLVNMKIGIPWDRLQVLPLNQKISIAGVDVTCLDANHCPGSIIILFEPPNGKAVLHTGDFRFCEEMANISILQSCSVQTLILDTTYCNPQYDFPKQEAVIQFVIEAIQAEAFNPKTLFLIGSYTIGKERLFLEVGRCLRKKIYVGAAKLRLLECLGIPQEDMQWFTLNEQESHIHVVPMWTIASFKRMKQISNQYAGRFNLIVAFSPTGWTFGKGKKKSPGRRWQQGTIIRYEVPYSEHCSFTELKEFVQFISPENIIPSVNNDGPESADAMIALLMS